MGTVVDIGRGRAARPMRPSAGPGLPYTRRAAFSDLLPAVDGLVALVAAGLLVGITAGSLAFACFVPPLVGLILGYHRPPVGGREAWRAALLLLMSAVVAQWLAFQVTQVVLGTATTHNAVALVAVTVLGSALVRQLRTIVERSRPERVVVLGSGIVADRLNATLERHRNRSMRILGYLDDGDQQSELECLGGLGVLHELVASGQVDRLIVAFSAVHGDAELLDALRDCDAYGVHVDVIPRLFEYLGTDTRSYSIGSLPLVTVRGRGGRHASRLVKRALDVGLTGALLVLAAPVMLVVALLVWLEDRGAVLYRQERVGRLGRPFFILKFRSMRVEPADVAQITRMTLGNADISTIVAEVKNAGQSRVTRVGAFIRRTSLDELPQLWNVLRGDMSIVGPRPLRDFEVASLSKWEASRHLERPGITGLWQVTGRSDVTWDERMLLDYSYVRHWSLASDAEILLRTVPAVLARNGAQ